MPGKAQEIIPSASEAVVHCKAESRPFHIIWWSRAAPHLSQNRPPSFFIKFCQMLKSPFHVFHKSPAVTGGFHGRWTSNHLGKKTPRALCWGGSGYMSSESFMHSTSFQWPEVSEIKEQQGSLCMSSRTVLEAQIFHVLGSCFFPRDPKWILLLCPILEQEI